MTNFQRAIMYAALLMGSIFGLTIILSDLIFGDLTQTDSIKPLWLILPIMAATFFYLRYKTK